MKIIAVGRNYAKHIWELNNAVPADPIIFLKPDTAVLQDNRPFYYPDFSSNIHFELELVLKIVKEGKHIDEHFAKNYYEEIGLGIDFTARDLQNKLKEERLPWELAKAFDHSAAISKFISKNNFSNVYDLHFELDIDGVTKQRGHTANVIFSFEKIISYVSKFITLKKGDLIFTGTPDGVGQISVGDRLTAKLNGTTMLDFSIK